MFISVLGRSSIVVPSGAVKEATPPAPVREQCFDVNMCDGDVEDDDFLWQCQCPRSTSGECRSGCTGLKGDVLQLRKFITTMTTPFGQSFKSVTAIEVFYPPNTPFPLLAVAYEGIANISKNMTVLWRPETLDIACVLNVPVNEDNVKSPELHHQCTDKIVAMTSFTWQGTGYMLTGSDSNGNEVRLWRWDVSDSQGGSFQLIQTIAKSRTGFDGTVSSIFLLDIVPFNPTDSGIPLEEDSLHMNKFLPAATEDPTVVPNAHIKSPWFIFGSFDKSCTVWTFSNDTLNTKDPSLVMIHRIASDMPNSHRDLILSVAAFQHGRDITVVTASWDKTLRYWTYSYHEKDDCWHHNTSNFPKVIRQHKKAVTAVIAHTFRIPHRFEVNADWVDEDDDVTDAVHHPSSRQQKYYFTSKVLITGSLDTTAIVWDLETGDVIRKLIGHESKITALRVFDTEMSGLPPLVITASEDETIIFWNLETGEQLRTLKTTAKISSVEIYPVSKGFVVVAGGSLATPCAGPSSTGPVNQSQLLLVNMQRIERIRRIDTDAVTSIDWFYPRQGEHLSENVKRPLVAVGGIDNTCKVYDYRTCRLLATLNGHHNRINAAVIYTPRSCDAHPLLVTCAADNTLCVWDLVDFALVKTMYGHTKTVFTLAIYNPDLVSQDNLSTATATKDKGVIDLRRPCVISGGRDDYFLVWDLLDTSKSVVGPIYRKDKPHDNWIRFISVFHPSSLTEKGDSIRPCISFVTASYDTSVRLWCLRTFQCLREFNHQHKGYVFGTDFYDPYAHFQVTTEDALPENNRHTLLVTGSYDNTTVIWHLWSGKAIRRLRGHTESVTAVAVHAPKNPQHATQVPLVATCSIDKLVIVWNLLTGERLQTLVGHTDRVCFLSIFDPFKYPFSQALDATRPIHSLDFPTIISGGDDKMNIVWEDTLYPTKIMPTRDTVNRAFAFDLTEEDWPMITRFASVESTQPGQIFLENPHLFQLAIRHNRPDFLLKFRSYLTKVLPYMNAYDDRSHLLPVKPRRHSTVLENMAYMDSQERKYWRRKRYMQDGSGTYISPLLCKKNILEYAIDRHDLISTRAILLSWTELLNQDITDMLTQRLYHPSYFFPDDALQSLSSVYPMEYMRFITSLRLIRNHPSLLEETRVKRLNQRDRLEVTGVHTRVSGFQSTWLARFDRKHMYWLRMVDMMDRVFLTRLSDEQPITSLMIPLKKTSYLTNSLRTYVQVCNQLDNVALFDSDIGRLTLQFCWEAYGRSAHLYATLVYFTFLGLFVTCIYVYQEVHRHGMTRETDLSSTSEVWLDIFNWVMIGGFGCYAIEELSQVYKQFGSVRFLTIALHIIRDVWNCLDLLIIVLGLIGLSMRVSYQRDTDTGRSFLAACSVCMWFKALYYMRPFSNSGPLVAMIVTIVKEIRILLLVLFFVLCGFTQAFWLLSNVSQDNAFGTVRKAFYNSFLYMLGQLDDVLFEDTVMPWFAVFLLVLFMMVMMILMLNLLIALMGDAFSSVREQGLALWRREQASIILDQQRSLSLFPMQVYHAAKDWLRRHVTRTRKPPIMEPTMTPSLRSQNWKVQMNEWLSRSMKYPPYLHVLKYSSDVNAGPTEGMTQLQELVDTLREQVTPFTDFDPTAAVHGRESEELGHEKVE